MEKFNVPTPKEPKNKHEIFDIRRHKSNNFHQVKDLTLIYNFAYISCSKTNTCFNGNSVSIKDFHSLFEALKNFSKKTYVEMQNNHRFTHWHEVKWDDIDFKETTFLKCLTPQITKDIQTPTVYQFKVFDEARIMGFIHDGTFYPVWIDRNHKGYDRQNKGKVRRK
jgi:hypothetical protein